MLIKNAVLENCDKCGRFVREIEPERHGCDLCEKDIVPYGNDERLDITVFYNGDKRPDHFFFCSWRCVFYFASKVKTDHFFTLPYVSFDNKIKGRTAKDFMREMQKWRRD